MIGKGSVGIVKTRYFHLKPDLVLESGAVLKDATIAFEQYGKLNRQKSNAILVCHALSGDAHAAGLHEGEDRSGWWDSVIGPGKAFDTDRYCVICSNILGGCRGSTGPSSINPETGKPYGTSFPVITIADIVKAQKFLVESLGIPRLFCVAGGSMGGMQVLQWSISYPDMVKKAVVIATTGASTPQQIAFNEVGRKAIVSDPDWKCGDYYGSAVPVHGLALARMVGHITYLSDQSMHEKFGRNLQDKKKVGFDFSTDFRVESYLHHQGDTFTKRFDANSYLYITKAIDYFDISRNGSLVEGLQAVKASFLVISVTSDWLYPPYQSKDIVQALVANDCDVQYTEIRSNFGHDAFLLESGQLTYHISRFLNHTLVRDIMNKEVPTVPEGTSISSAAELMITKEINHLPVLSGQGTLTGIVTSWDIAKAVARNHHRLEDIMSRNVVAASPGDTIETAAKKMEEHTISALPVIDEERKVIGIISSEMISTLIGRYK